MRAAARQLIRPLRRLARALGVRGPFEPTRWVWSRGLALCCDHYGGLPFVRDQGGGRPEQPLRPEAYAGVRDGDLVWVRATALPSFLREALPRISARFALLSGDEDWSIPTDFAQAAELAADERIVCWFAQNRDGTGLVDAGGRQIDKLLPLPIGLDFHTISLGRRWGHAMATPAEQQEELERLRRRMPPTAARRLRVHADFHFNRHARPLLGETRGQIEAALRANPLLEFQRRKVSRLRLWREKTRYAFVVSPHGNGLDCHRTWESLALGNVVIVRHSPLDSLYAGLPVAIVDDWSEISETNLRRWLDELAPRFEDPQVLQRLTNDYWIGRVRAEFRRRSRVDAGAADAAG